jgi:16S rRNA (guanine527-N7)-methyltransferase
MMFHVKQIELLKQALDRLNVDDRNRVIGLFEQYEELLLRWNQKMNLISKKDEARIVPRHFLESIGFAVAFHFPPDARVIDLGSGAGFPGIPLRLIRPDLKLFLIESKSKKARFLETVVRDLSLSGVEVNCARVENIRAEIDPVDVVVSRSVASLSVLLKWSRRLLKQKTGVLVTVKGKGLEEELIQLRKAAKHMGISQWEIKEFNPFPEICPLDHSDMVIIKNG